MGSPLYCPLLSYLEVVGCPLSCQLSCPLFPYMEEVGSLVCIANFPGAAHGKRSGHLPFLRIGRPLDSKGGGVDQWKFHFWWRRFWSLCEIMYSTIPVPIDMTLIFNYFQCRDCRRINKTCFPVMLLSHWCETFAWKICPYKMFSLYPVSTVANVENNELRIENNAFLGHILLALFYISLISYLNIFFILLRSRDRRECFKQFKTFASYRRTEENAQ